MGSVSFTAIEPVLEEIHRQRRIYLRQWQESLIKRNQRAEYGIKFSDDYGKILCCLCLVHPSWTNDVRLVLGRILLLPDITLRSVRAAASSVTFGSWTREAYLSFSRARGRDDNDIIWNHIGRIITRTPDITSLCLHTSVSSSYTIDHCAKRLCDVLPELNQLHTFRIYADAPLEEARNSCLNTTELPSLFHKLESFPNIERLVLRNFLPCFKFVEDERIDWIQRPYYDWHPITLPDPYVVTKLVADSPSLTGRIRSLANLIQSICNTPMEVSDEFVVSMANCMRFASFKFDPASQQFTINGARIGHDTKVRVPDILPPSFEYLKWCGPVEFLELHGSYNVIKRLYPYPSLRFLQAAFSTSHGASAHTMRDEITWFLDSLPPSLEILGVRFYWEIPENQHVLSPEMHDEIDELLASIPSTRCPNLTALSVGVESVSQLFRTKRPLKSLIQSCKERRVPLNLFPYKDPEYYGGWEPGLERSFMIENHID
ncbi:hypothetical protein SCHPADRAFT_995236 [Schizopora paradoxa]|uniref:Uncharacterized protein n=1 Tax=Schizopora paradoxa TaxID=27342 RepID=A0A0H2S3D6_9AGAM|nr:hypothetical protein SCHPADRAFT_995236 [Schizopora paradoxa]